MSPQTPASAATLPIGLGAQFLRHSPRYGVGMLLLAAYQFGQYYFDMRLGEAVDAVANGGVERAIFLGQLIMAVALASFIVRVLSRMAIFNGGRIAEYELRKALLYHLHRLGPSFYRRVNSGEIMSRFTSDLAQVRALLGFGVLSTLNTAFALVSALAVMLQVSFALTITSLAPLPILLLVMRSFARQIYERQRANQESIGELSSRVQSSIAGIRVVRSFSLERAELESFELVNQRYLKKALALARLRGSMWPVMQSITAVGVVIVFWYGGHLMLEQELSEGDFLKFYRALSRLAWPLIAIGFLLSVLQRGRAGYSRLKEIFDARPDIVDGPERLPQTTATDLEVRHLSFNYGDVPILSDVSFRLEPGKSLAIVGRTGSGKSTLAALLARLEPTPKGCVFINGKDVCQLPVSEVRQRIGYAQQDPFLFSTTVALNIGYVLDNADAPEAQRRIREVAAEAQILDEVEQLPDRFDTIVGERGVQLSGGQKQRVALARALVSQPQILILDDPLSAVDARTESAILGALERQRAHRSVMLITHRVRAAAACDRIVVLSQGRIVEQGTHRELLARQGLYATFEREQRIEGELEELGEAGDVQLHEEPVGV